MSNKPLILTDNIYENVVLHPSHLLSNRYSTDVPGADIYHVADNLRDMTRWQPVLTNSNNAVEIDTGVTTSSPSCVVIDRGHNLAGQTVSFQGAADTSFAGAVTGFTSVIPSSPGGLPSDPNGCVTPDGVWWKTFSPIVGKKVFGTFISAMGVGLAPIITGLYAGAYYRFTEFMDAPAAYDYGTQIKYQRNELSRGAVRVKSRPMNFDKIAFSVGLESVDYAGFDAEIRRMLRYNAPCWFAFDDSDASGVGQVRMFQLPGDLLYDPRVNPVHREIRGEFEECVPSLYV